MPIIESCTERIEPVGPDARGAALLARFQDEPGTLAIPVVDDGRPLGLVSRDALLLMTSRPFGLALCRKRPVTDLMDAEPVIVDSGMELHSLPASMIEGSAASLLGAFIITQSGRYFGVASGAALVQLQNRGLRMALDAQKAAPAPTDLQTDTHAANRTAAFVARLGQALRNPLNGVGAVAELLRRQRLSAGAQAHVQTIVESADATLRVLENALDLARAEAGDLEVKPAPCPLRPLVDRLQDDWRGPAAAADVNLMLSYEGDTDLIAEIDGGRLGQVMDALIANAVEQARHGVVEASLSAHRQGEAIVLTARVRDDGADPDRADVRLHDAPDTAGLGLAYADRIVSALGGRLEIGRNRGQGVTFRFSLKAPVAVAETDEAVSNVSEMAGLSLPAAPHVLIVDDNATNRVVAQALCEMFGCSCETAEDGEQAVEAVSQRRFDVVLMDIKMPRMDGVQATRAIRALEGEASTVPIIALTANADPDDARRYIEAGMAAVVEKPIKPERLRLAMNTALAAEQSEAEAAVRAA